VSDEKLNLNPAEATRKSQKSLRTPLRRVGSRTDQVRRPQRRNGAFKRAAELTKAGQFGQVVAAMAEAGVGKSRLFYEFKAISQSGCLVLEVFPFSQGKACALLPVIERLWNYFEITSDDGERAPGEKIAGRVLALDVRWRTRFPACARGLV